MSRLGFDEAAKSFPTPDKTHQKPQTQRQKNQKEWDDQEIGKTPDYSADAEPNHQRRETPSDSALQDALNQIRPVNKAFRSAHKLHNMNRPFL